jgi:hypothetical protein
MNKNILLVALCVIIYQTMYLADAAPSILELMKRSQLNEYAKNAGVYHKNGRYGSGKKHHGPSYITNVDACLFGCEDCFGNEVAEQNINDVCC